MPSDLPILPSDPPDAPRRSLAERYGGLFYLGLGGLAVLGALLVWFLVGLWGLRDILWDVYVLHDASRSEAERIQAAHELSRDSRVPNRQFWDMALRKELPPLARYLLAESLTSEAVMDDPRGYALAVSRSPDWPDWLRLLIARPLAYAAGRGATIPLEPLRELMSPERDPFLRLWAAYAVLAGPFESASAARGEARKRLDEAIGGEDSTRELAVILSAALEQSGPRRDAALDRATQWLRTGYPPAREIWSGWTLDGDRLERVASQP